MKRYPTIPESNRTLKGALDALDFIARVRLEDIGDRNNFPNLFVGGRKVRKIPSASNDIVGSAVGDFNVTVDHAYFCIDNAGTVEWVRVAVGTF